MIRFNFLNIETVLCIARLGTYSAAADYLHTTQPAVSARVKELERSLGLVIFEKRGRQVELTPAGLLFVEKFEPVVAEVQRAYFEFKEHSAQVGRIRIGMRDVCVPWFGQLLQQIYDATRTVTYEVEVDIAIHLVKRVEEGKIDCAIIPGVIDRPGVACTTLGYSRTVWVMAEDRCRRYGLVDEPARLADLLNCGPIWLMPRTSTFYDRQIDVLRSQGAKLHNINACNSTMSLIQMIGTTGGLGCVAADLVQEDLARKRLVVASGDLKSVESMYSIAYLEGRVDPVLDAVIAFVVHNHGLPASPGAESLVWNGFYR